MDAEGWLASGLATFGCGACGQAYGEGHVRLIAQREELYFVDLTCRHCGSQAVAIVTIQVDGEQPALETDDAAPAGEVSAARDMHGEPISADDVLDAHALLDGFEGDVYRLIARFRGEER